MADRRAEPAPRPAKPAARNCCASRNSTTRFKTNEKLSSWQRRQLARFSRKLALSAQMLLPDLFDLLTAARGVVDDNFAWEVWHAAGQWPWQLAESELENPLSEQRGSIAEYAGACVCTGCPCARSG